MAWIGIDVGRAAVKVAVLRAQSRRLEVLGLCSIERTPDQPVQMAVAEAVREALGTATIASSDAVAVALPGSVVSTKVLTLPSSASKQLQEILAFELDSQLPFDVTEAVFDHRKLTPTSRGEMRLMVAVAKIEDVRAQIELIKEATGQEPERVCAGAFPLAGVLGLLQPPLEPARTSVLVVDIGTSSTDILVVDGAEALFARTLSIGTSGLPANAAKLAREVRISLAAYSGQGGETPTSMVLAGGGAFVPGATAFLSRELGLPVDVIAQLSTDLSASAAQRAGELAKFAKAIGIAMSLSGKVQTFNLRRGALGYERGFAWLREKAPALIGFGVALSLSLCLSAAARLHVLSIELHALQKQLGDVTEQMFGERTEDTGRAKELVDEHTGLSEEDPMPRADGFDVMVRLSEAIPSDLKHDVEELNVQKNRVTMRGVVDTPADADKVREALMKQRCFTDVKMGGSNAQPGTNRQKYNIEWEIRCPEDAKARASQAAGTSSAGGK
jgi:general secretion pathway protein L